MITEIVNSVQKLNCPEIAWVVVNYFNDADTIRFIRLNSCNDTECRIVFYVVNNGSKDESKLKEALMNFKEVSLVPAGSNRGYMGGFCLSIDTFYNSYKCYPSKAILSNTDLEIIQPGFNNSILEVQFERQVAGIGPEIIHAVNNRDQNPLYLTRPSRLKLKFLCFIFSLYPFYLIYQFLYYLKGKTSVLEKSNNCPQEVYAIHGSFMMLSEAFIKKHIEELKSAPFLFGEELFIAELCRKTGMKLIIDRKLKVIHNEHAVTGRYKTRAVVKHLRNSVKVILEKFY